MKTRYKLLAALLCVGSMISCTDGFESANSDPNKIYDVSLRNIFPGTVKKTMDVMSELNFNRMWYYSRQVTSAWGSNAWEGTDAIYREFYVDIMRDLKALEKNYRDNEEHPNNDAVVRTWKAFLYYQLLSLYGPVGLDGAVYDDINKRSFTYSSEKDVYFELLDDLDAAVNLFDTKSKDAISSDPVYDGDVEKWRKLANTLRLDMGLTVMNISEEKSREACEKAMAHEDWLFSSLADALAPKYGTVIESDGSYYYKWVLRDKILDGKTNWAMIPSMNEYFAAYLYTYNDPRMYQYFQASNATSTDDEPVKYLMPDVITRGHDCDVSNCTADERASHIQLMIEGYELRDSIRVAYNIAYPPSPDNAGARTPFDWQAALDPTDPMQTLRMSDPLSFGTEQQKCFINFDLCKVDCTLPMLRWCDALFDQAEAAARYGLGSKSAKEYYDAAIRASFQEWGLLDKAGEYLAQDGVAWGTDHEGYPDSRRLMTASINGSNGLDGHIEQIIKQRWFADFLDGMSVWRFERRTRAINLPPLFIRLGNQYFEGGNPNYSFPERLQFTDGERNNNADAYYEAIGILQQNSPKPNDGRWGDNCFTTLQFAKPVPTSMIEWCDRGCDRHTIDYNLDMQKHCYGATYEDILRYCQQKTGITDNPDEALKYLGYTVRSVINKAYTVEK